MDQLAARCRAAGVLRPDVAGTDLATLLHAVQAAAQIGGTTRPDHWRRTLGLLLDGLAPARGTHHPLPGAPLSGEEFHEVMTLSRPR